MSAKGEKYSSMAAMKKHETKEGPAARMKEYGSKTGGSHKMPNGKMMPNSAMPKKAAKKMGAKKK